jgi:P-type E1-E2 ATPase
MIELTIPGFGEVRLQHAVFDYNGTLARDGILLPGVAQLLTELAGQLSVHILTADTFGQARSQLSGLPVQLHILTAGAEAEQKAAYLTDAGPESTVAVGNGMNDAAMLQRARVGIVVTGDEGTAVRALQAADVVTRNITEAIGLLRNPKRLTATLRS